MRGSCRVKDSTHAAVRRTRRVLSFPEGLRDITAMINVAWSKQAL
jgi:hypothetical protein